ncbi:MAG TPA: hypothetical protein VFC56_12450 [Stellaceae bacterium]|nr:hypothetical protein [Stellaceae bacterium]
MRLLILAPVSLLFLAGAAGAQEQPSSDAAAATPPAVETPVAPAHHRHHHRSRVAHERAEEAKAVAAEDSESRIGQVPAGVVGPPGQRIPEVGPPVPKTDTAATPAEHNTANCTGTNTDSKECYSATQQTKGK